MINELTLIPELEDLKKVNGDDFDIQDWVTSEGNIRLAIGYSVIFWPDFIEHDGCVFLKPHFSIGNYNEWANSEIVKNYGQIESVINHTHILDLFSLEKQEDINYDQVMYLGTVLRDIYDLKLKAQFPKRKFIVEFNIDENTDDLLDYHLTFYQKNNEKRKTKNGS